MKRTVLAVTSVLIFGAFNYGIYKKESIKAHGETVFLLLGTADPRSFMQGDYMQLRYKLDDQQIPEYNADNGYIVIVPDENKVGTFNRFHRGERLAAGEKLIHYVGKYGSAHVVPDTFMFQEGHANVYARARYGVFKFDGARDYILTDLADDKFQILQPPKTEPKEAPQ